MISLDDLVFGHVRTLLRNRSTSRAVMVSLACVVLVIVSAFLIPPPTSLLSVGRSTAEPAPVSSVLPIFGDHIISARSVRLPAEKRMLAGSVPSANVADADRILACTDFNELTAALDSPLRTTRWRLQASRAPPHVARPTTV
jgi:hypothetical protein